MLSLAHPRSGVGTYVGPNRDLTGKTAHIVAYNDYLMVQFDDRKLGDWAFGRHRFEWFEFKNVRLYE
jgi:hypothetical protein